MIASAPDITTTAGSPVAPDTAALRHAGAELGQGHAVIAASPAPYQDQVHCHAAIRALLNVTVLPASGTLGRRRADVKTMPGTTRRVIVLTAWAVYVKPGLSTLVVDLGLTGLPNVVGIDTVRIVIPRLKVPLIVKSRPHAPQPSQGAGPWRRKTPPLWWTNGVGQADPSHLRLRRT